MRQLQLGRTSVLVKFFNLNTKVKFGYEGARWLSRFVCTYHPTVQGSIPKYTTYALKYQILYYICHCVEKRTKINKKRPGLAHIYLKK